MYRIYAQLEDCRQQDDQPLQSFVTELQSLEAELTPFPDGMRRQMLLAKIKPSLVIAVNWLEKPPATLQDLISFTARIDENQRNGRCILSPRKCGCARFEEPTKQSTSFSERQSTTGVWNHENAKGNPKRGGSFKRNRYRRGRGRGRGRGHVALSSRKQPY
jgi:hypothetical protein